MDFLPYRTTINPRNKLNVAGIFFRFLLLAAAFTIYPLSGIFQKKTKIL